jgi:ABC-type multidrug transport system ATPase subunit
MSVRVELAQVKKRFKNDWVLWNVDLQIEEHSSWAVTGPNGSGKSTLLKILSGHLSPSKGLRKFYQDRREIPVAEIYREVAFAAPYIDLIEEFKLEEAISFHRRLKPFLREVNAQELISILGFEQHRNKELRFFSSGMKQRLKLALACCSAAPLLLLDEPTSNLDEAGIRWYRELLEEFSPGRTLVIASNVEEDLQGCQNRIHVLDFKRPPRK